MLGGVYAGASRVGMMWRDGSENDLTRRRGLVRAETGEVNKRVVVSPQYRRFQREFQVVCGGTMS